MTDLTVSNLSVGYGKILAVRNASLHVRSGRIVALLGRNGAGKSTLLRSVTGLKKPVSGEVRIGDREMGREPPWKRAAAGVAFVPEASGIVRGMTVWDNLRLGGYRRGVAAGQLRQEADHLLAENFPFLCSRLDTVAGTLSGGQRQMLAIARALMAEPKLLLFDEPSFGLAPMAVAEVFDLMRELAVRGIGILFSEQNAAAAFGVADYAYVMDRGEIVMEGEAIEVRDNPQVDRHLFV